ncbi:hypothetical protein GCM10011529_20160 [Polymorphobacter glacialis]|uniref:Uncharacterized protein n=1 Tax=Sandarakinorhabdus glacialis TaxID=1614636 RepID=A0A916ZUE8_9SPHN|nr:hypothetical protein [Polymorphobacter glacialis]GGE13760.1 hypothetical protein GCM10011529_20160 [Polymorphobacter glacialis]
MRNYSSSALMLFVTMAAVIGSYTVNLKVSGERAAVRKLERQLVADAHDMRMLEVELRTRARLPEMQRWNDSVLQMSAPAAGQYLNSAVQLVAYAAVPAGEAAALPGAIVAANPAVRFAVAGDAAQPAPAAARIVQVTYSEPARALVRAAQPVEHIVRAARPERAISAPPAPMTARIIRAGYSPGAMSSSSGASQRRIVDAIRRPAPQVAMRSIVDTLVIPVGVPSSGAAPIDLLPEGGQ